MSIDFDTMDAIEAYGNARLRMGAAVAQGHAPSVLRAERESASTLEALEAIIATPHLNAEWLDHAVAELAERIGWDDGRDLSTLLRYTERVYDKAIRALPPAPHGGAEAVGTDLWPPIKMALWQVLMDEKLNAGHYIKAFDLIEKLYSAVLASPPQEQEAAPKGEAVAFKICDRGLSGNVLDELWPVLGGNMQDAELWHDIGDAVVRALGPYADVGDTRTAAPSPKAEPVEQPYSVAEHIAHDIREGRFPARSTIEQFKAERAPKTEPEQETVAAEREACAKLVETAAEPYVIHSDTGAMMFRACTEKLAAAIRARGQRAPKVQP